MSYWSLAKILTLAFILIFVNSVTLNSQSFSVHLNQNTRNLQAIQIDPTLADQAPSPLTPQLPSTVFQKESIENRSFANLVVYHDIPSTLSSKELYSIRGRVINPSDHPEQNFVRFIITNTQTKQSFRRTQHLSSGFFEFNILLDLRILPNGKYKLESQVGKAKGQWKQEIEVFSSDKSSKNTKVAPPKRPENLKIDFVNYELVLSWKQDTTAALSKIEFVQAGRVRSYTLSNFVSRFKIPLRDFADFEADSVYVTLWNAHSDSSSLSGRISQYSRPVQLEFTAAPHKFIVHEEAELALTKQLPFRVKKGERVSIKGTAVSSIQNKITIQTPLKTFQHEWFQTDKKDFPNVPQNTQVEKNLLMTEEGIYVIQVNNNLQVPIMVWPVIVGDSYPLLPHYYDFLDEDNPDPNAKPGQPEGIEEQRKFLLQFINKKRAEFDVSPLVIEDKLNEFAQGYSLQMIKNKLYSHINIAGLGPQERATKAGIKKRITQIFGFDKNLTLLINYIFILPKQLETIVSEEWRTIGFGLPREQNGYFVASMALGGRNYAEKPLTKLQIIYYRNQLASLITQKYPRILEQNKRLSTLVSEWQNGSALFKILNKLETYLAKYGFLGSVIKTLTINLQPNFIDTQLSRSPLIIPPNLSANKIGIGMKQVEGHSFEIIVAYN